MIYSLVGFMACGKSTVGRILADKTGIKFIDLDEYIVNSCGLSIPEIFDRFGENAFRELETIALSKIFNKETNLILSLGGGTFINEESRKLITKFSKSIYLQTDFEKIVQRLLKNTQGRPLSKNADFLYKVREPIYSKADLIINTLDKSPEEIADTIIEAFLS